MNRSLRCKCGTLRGQLSQVEKCTRLVCYCKDCQAFAHYLGHPGDILDPMGGTDILAAHPQSLAFTEGQHALACMSLSESGMLRWYASCCNTPIGNTARDVRMAYVGLVHACLADPSSSIESTFGPVRMRSGTKSAKGRPPSSVLGAIATIAGFAFSLVRARLNGSYKRTPFFNVEPGTPVVEPKVLSRQERARLDAACSLPGAT
jgi:hypothetical protein